MFSFANRYDGVTGSAIRNIFALLGDPEMISFAGGNPSPKTFDGDTLGAIAERLLREQGATLLQYGNTPGYQPLRETVAAMCRAEGVDCTADNVIITSGSSQGIDLTVKAFCNEGDCILVEAPTFLGALQTFVLYGTRPISVELDEGGVVLEDLERKIALYKPKLFYVIPTFQNPSGRTLAEDRRKALVELCAKNGVVVMEDDPYGALRFTGTPLPSLKSYDRWDAVIRFMSFSKTISPGLRVGAAIAHTDIIHKLNLGKQGQDVHTSLLNQAMVNEYVTSGGMAENVRKSAALYKTQMEAMYAAIEREFPASVRVQKPDGGMFLWAELPEGVDSMELFSAAVAEKVAFVPGTHFYAEGGHLNTLRLNYTMETTARIDSGITRLGAIIRNMV